MDLFNILCQYYWIQLNHCLIHVGRDRGGFHIHFLLVYAAQITDFWLILWEIVPNDVYFV